MSTKVIFLIGRPGCGKETQLKFLIEKTGFKVIKTGELLRKKAEEDDSLGRKTKEVLSEGKLMPTPVVFMLWMPMLAEFHEQEDVKGVVFDGNPRKFYEAKMLEEVFDMFGWEEIKTCYIKISEKEAYERLRKRKRMDDTDDEIRERLSWFKDEVEPVIDYFREKGILVEINGEQSVEDVWKEIEGKLCDFIK
ncbi:MAG: nucleoside monophosphate kinase [Patescibacteria group bacterium]|nr:nucleoside monophosphate kinase [Patescibacteria group bacterium]